MDIRMYKCGFGDCFRIIEGDSLYVDFGYLKRQGCPKKIDKNKIFDDIINDIVNDKNKKEFLLTHYHEDHYNGAIYMFDPKDKKKTSYPHEFNKIYIPDIWRIGSAIDVVSLHLIADILNACMLSRHHTIFDFLKSLCKTNGIVKFIKRGDTINNNYIALWPCEEFIDDYLDKHKKDILDDSNVDDELWSSINQIAKEMIKITVGIADREDNRESYGEEYERLYQDYRNLAENYRKNIKYTVQLKEFANDISIIFQNKSNIVPHILFTGDFGKDITWDFIEGNEDNKKECQMYEKYKVVKIPHHGTSSYYKEFRADICMIPNFWRNEHITHYIDIRYLQDAYEKKSVVIFGDNPRDYYYTDRKGVMPPYNNSTDKWIDVI